MARFSNEFLVGLLFLFVVAATVFGVLRTSDRPEGVAGFYKLYVDFPSAEGVYADTPVRIAGVGVGSVQKIELVGSTAHAQLGLMKSVALPVDSYAELKSEGMLGDKFIRITPGTSAEMLKDGDTLRALPPGADLDAVTAKVSAIADDVKAITTSVRSVSEDQATRDQLKSTIDNIAALSTELRAIAGENRQDLAAIADNLRQVSETLARVVDKTGQSVDVEMGAIQGATATLDRTVSNLESISGKIDNGQGTVGRLINDPNAIDSINATLGSVNDTVNTVNGLVSDVSKIKTEVYYRGDYFYGTDPNDPDFATNPVSGATRNVVGLRLMPREDYWYQFEFVSSPLGSISYEDHYVPTLGTAYREYVVRPDYRISFQFAKRFHDLVLRFGIKESSGGIGADLMLFHDRMQLSADVYDFTYGSWPVMNGTPNVQITARAYPWRHVYVEGGVDNVVLGAEYGYLTGFAGAGFSFDDQDLKFVLAALPLSP